MADFVAKSFGSGRRIGFCHAEAGVAIRAMMGQLNRDQGQLFYCFNLEEVVLADHLVRAIAGVLDLSWVRAELPVHYSPMGWPSIDPLLMIGSPTFAGFAG
jgi:hypothetical protein